MSRFGGWTGMLLIAAVILLIWNVVAILSPLLHPRSTEVALHARFGMAWLIMSAAALCHLRLSRAIKGPRVGLLAASLAAAVVNLYLCTKWMSAG